MSRAGLWGPAAGEAIGTLVLAHPMGKAAKGFWLRYGHADLFRKSGFHVLAFDANGFGASAAASFNYPGEILAAGLWAQGRHPALAVGLVGASFGAGLRLCAMARAQSPFRAAVLSGIADAAGVLAPLSGALRRPSDDANPVAVA